MLGLILLRSQCVKAPSPPFPQCVRCLQRFSFNLTCTSLLAPSVHSRFSFVSGLSFSGFTIYVRALGLGTHCHSLRANPEGERHSSLRLILCVNMEQQLGLVCVRNRECKCSRGEKGSCRESEVKGLIVSVRSEKGLRVNEIYRCWAYPTSKLWKVICLKKPLQCFTPHVLVY
ncbi:hypothetical protein V8G54_024020 [Vigna mungo]|uniref:Uncharacterized protein n=1 Tax=Vigna mungo TaxID=3915 RepID=A0AAQ3RSU0_VIGMU